jgi:hypothetical protein
VATATIGSSRATPSGPVCTSVSRTHSATPLPVALATPAIIPMMTSVICMYSMFLPRFSVDV